jgi:hypothetical protein
MKSLIGVMQVISVSGPHPIVKAELQVSSTDELPELYELVDGVIVGPGSISQLIEDGGFVTIDEDGDWKPSGSTPDAAASSLSMSAPKNLGRIRNEQPIEEIEEITEEPAVKEQKKVFEESIEEPEKDGAEDDELL